MRRSLTPLALVPFMLAACDTGEVGEADVDAMPTTEMAQPVDNAAVEAEMARIKDAWVQAAEAGDAASIAALYTDDARMVGATGQLAEGRQGIEESLSTGLEGMTELEVNSTSLVVGSDVLSDFGTFTQTFQTPDGQTQTVEGRYLVVLERQPDGSWKIAQHLSAVPPESEGM